MKVGMVGRGRGILANSRRTWSMGGGAQREPLKGEED